VKISRSLAAMTTRFRLRPGWGLAIALGLLLTPASGFAAPEQVRNHFDSDAPMRAPGFFDLLVLGAPGDAEWRVMAEFNPPSTPNALSQVKAKRPVDSIAAAIRRNVQLKDGTLSVGLRKADARGGVVFRMTDEKNFAVLLLDSATGEARLLRYKDGQSTELAQVKVAPIARGWGDLVVTLAGPKISAVWEGKPLLEAADPAPVSGRTGLATAGPGIASFDAFVIDPTE
jgi:hypothetical protein